jgi:hypothetical protein
MDALARTVRSMGGFRPWISPLPSADASRKSFPIAPSLRRPDPFDPTSRAAPSRPLERATTSALGCPLFKSGHRKAEQHKSQSQAPSFSLFTPDDRHPRTDSLHVCYQAFRSRSTGGSGKFRFWVGQGDFVGSAIADLFDSRPDPGRSAMADPTRRSRNGPQWRTLRDGAGVQNQPDAPARGRSRIKTRNSLSSASPG